MTFKTFIEKQGEGLHNTYNYWYPKPDFETEEEYILSEYLSEINKYPITKQKALLLWREQYLENNK